MAANRHLAYVDGWLHNEGLAGIVRSKGWVVHDGQVAGGPNGRLLWRTGRQLG